ncbi:MAG TPA: response regulator [Abditibacteriaceae bacterium]|jgi:PAS domain S-box-containing protein
MHEAINPITLLSTPFEPPSPGRDEALAEALKTPLQQSLKVLIADDSPLVAKMLSTVLRRAGYEVVTAPDGIEAAQAIYREQPDVILLDIFMPRMNGYQVCRLIKQDALTSHIPVLINTASEGRSAEFWSRHTGADGFILKGVPSEELLAAIARVIESKPRVAPEDRARLEIPTAEEILSKVCALVDQELYATTVKSMELQTMLRNLTEGILIVDNDGFITSANHFLCSLLGIDESELKDRSCAEALNGCVTDTLRQLISEALASDSPVSRESEIIARDGAHSGHTTPVEISAVAVTDYMDETVGAICVFQDITRRREIQALNRLKNDLTDMIVHDLRTPLTSLLTGMQVMPSLGELNADQHEFMNISIEGGQTLLAMINDLLDISKMEDGSMQIAREPITAEDLLRRAMRQVSSLAEDKSLQLICDIGTGTPTLHVDDDKLTRTLVNLMSNAIKFTPANGSITLSVHFVSRPERRDSVVFACRDTGHGIPEAAFERIFEKFGQVKQHVGEHKMSTGLGLTFCKMAVEAHGGRIWVQSAVGQGSTFFFAVPTVAKPV